VSLKVCEGDHHYAAACVTCDEDAKRCDICWEDNPEDQHDDLRPYRLWSNWNDGRPEDVTTLNLCKSCYRKFRDGERIEREEWGV